VGQPNQILYIVGLLLNSTKRRHKNFNVLTQFTVTSNADLPQASFL